MQVLDGNQVVNASSTAKPMRKLCARFRTLLGLISACAMFGLLAAFHIPIQLVLMASAGFAVLCLFLKFSKDNLRLMRQIGIRRLLKTSLISIGIFVPVALVLVPGLWLGDQVNYYANRGIEQLQLWSAPDIVSKEVEKKIQVRIEEKIKRDLPW